MKVKVFDAIESQCGLRSDENVVECPAEDMCHSPVDRRILADFSARSVVQYLSMRLLGDLEAVLKDEFVELVAHDIWSLIKLNPKL